MRLCIPTLDDQGPQARLCAHFGSAPWFTFLDTETEEVESVQNDNDHRQHGTCSPLRLLEGRKLDGLVVGGIGRGALSALASEGIAVYQGSEATVAGILDDARADRLVRIDLDMACAGRGHGHGSGRGMGGGGGRGRGH